MAVTIDSHLFPILGQHETDLRGSSKNIADTVNCGMSLTKVSSSADQNINEG